MQETILVKKESAGFAYSAHEKVIKLKIRPARDGWFFEERGGTKGGTLEEQPAITVESEASAEALLRDKVAKAVADGYQVIGATPTASPTP